MKDLKPVGIYRAFVCLHLLRIHGRLDVFGSTAAFIVLPILDVIAGESATNLDGEVAAEKNGMWMSMPCSTATSSLCLDSWPFSSTS